ncbi:hypothetical protein FXB40_47515 [Bradyrhizobium rifense]|uniref:Uncharacterized protein n=1 Tax=Bradyrhizobium rifense TaxID=515499 RepID=A0A5D3JXE5_9BRAD|nr:hypothetical protein [Bradyrhizobium rifense]TYL80840.1 hypothetical protein FXB40_47515 [Bradyrhizobium rifense]
MPETDPEYMSNVFVKVDGKERLNELCSILRGLLYANRQSDGKIKKNQEFSRGVTIHFGNGPDARDFIKSIKHFLKKTVRKRLTVQLQG